jgi:site-specific DNA-methyltransferase (adenine-specific)
MVPRPGAATFTSWYIVVKCLRCKSPIPQPSTGRPPSYCSPACRQAGYRKRAFRNAQAVTILAQRAAKKQHLDDRRRAVEQAINSAALSSDVCQIDQADCLEWFASQPAGSLHLVFGSSPYEDARTYGIDFTLRGEAWVAWMVQVFEAALRCCTGVVAFVVDGKTENFRWSATPALLMADLHRRGIHLRHPAIYERDGIPGSGGPDWLKNRFEFIVCATRGGQLPWSDPTAMGQPPKHSAKSIGTGTSGHSNGDLKTVKRYIPPNVANPGNVIRCNVGGNRMGDLLAHEGEAPFAEELVEFLIRSFCPPNGIVCDPFLGSGTTAKVALALGRRFRGCDIRGEAVLLSKQRIIEANSCRSEMKTLPG